VGTTQEEDAVDIGIEGAEGDVGAATLFIENGHVEVGALVPSVFLGPGQPEEAPLRHFLVKLRGMGVGIALLLYKLIKAFFSALFIEEVSDFLTPPILLLGEGKVHSLTSCTHRL
jgi:hypothetical protein